jgi:hypothetical protein
MELNGKRIQYTRTDGQYKQRYGNTENPKSILEIKGSTSDRFINKLDMAKERSPGLEDGAKQN